MTKFTEPQMKALTAAFKKNGALYARGSSRAGGAFRRCAQRLADQGYLSDTPPFPITVKGLMALRDVRAARFGRRGCEADRLDLEEVEVALADVPHMAEYTARKAG